MSCANALIADTDIYEMEVDSEDAKVVSEKARQI